MSSFHESDVDRRPAGRPSGGQFAKRPRPASGITLGGGAGMPTMREMRAAVVVDDWRSAECGLRFMREEGAEVEEATVRTGRWTADGRLAGSDVADGQEYVRLTMDTGVERFVPFREMQRMVLEHRAAERDD